MRKVTRVRRPKGWLSDLQPPRLSDEAWNKHFGDGQCFRFNQRMPMGRVNLEAQWSVAHRDACCARGMSPADYDIWLDEMSEFCIMVESLIKARVIPQSEGDWLLNTATNPTGGRLDLRALLGRVCGSPDRPKRYVLLSDPWIDEAPAPLKILEVPQWHSNSPREKAPRSETRTTKRTESIAGKIPGLATSLTSLRNMKRTR